jgi:hypothetical protein
MKTTQTETIIEKLLAHIASECTVADTDRMYDDMLDECSSCCDMCKQYGASRICYQRIGQHGGATPDLMRGQYTRPATDAEIEPLASELYALGYNLKPMKRFPRNAFEVRKGKAAL